MPSWLAGPGLAGVAPHRPHRGRAACLDHPELFKSVALVERLVQRARRLEVDRQLIPVTALERTAEQCRAVSAALFCDVDADERQVPVRFGGVDSPIWPMKPRRHATAVVDLWLRRAALPGDVDPSPRAGSLTFGATCATRWSPRPCGPVRGR
jgi:hypothetical protein